ncbi:M48 family metalloprotease [Streptomyces sp. NPDC096152]|uniref:M48 family metalloprotease n=1 Tax=Streptomyces sp. NPDC096152 TaxID=3366078 RepID=UPI0037F1547C
MSQSPDPAVPPPGPSYPTAEPPRYDTTGPALPYPGTTPPQYPPAPVPEPPYPAAPPPAPAYPDALTGAAPYPDGSATAAPPYPDAATARPHPDAATGAPAYAGASLDAPGYPNAPASPPTHPGANPFTSGAAPAHPGGTQPYPGGDQPYPGTGPGRPAGGPAHPGTAPAHPQAATPPPPGMPSQAPFGAASAAGATGAGMAAPAAPPVPEPSVAPDDLDYRHRGSRVLVAEHQRGADATAIGRLAVQVPGFLVSLAVVSSIALGMFGDIAGTIVLLAWLASGALVFHRPTELAFARHVLKLRPPTPDERARLEPVWREVTARAGVEAHTYELMVENSDELNAVAAAGHVVGVTTYSLNRIPSSNLAAVLAHELGHHTGGHAWAGLLGYWYSLPGRVAWAFMRGMARIALAVSRVFSLAATGLLYLFLGITVVAGFLTMWYVTIPLVAAPYLLAHMGRRGELRADQQAAELGFARHLAEVLHHFQTEEAAAKAAAEAQGQKLQDPGTLSRLLSSHPDHHTRLTALEPYLRLHR